MAEKTCPLCHADLVDLKIMLQETGTPSGAPAGIVFGYTVYRRWLRVSYLTSRRCLWHNPGICRTERVCIQISL